MAAENYADALRHVLKYEGGWSDHPHDTGGATMRGVIQRTYTGYRKGKELKVQSVKNITDAELAEIYRNQYAAKVRFDDIPAGVDFVIFDGAVNSGPAQSVKWLQRALGIKVDGLIGEATLAAVAEHPDHDRLIADVLTRRMAFLRALRTWRYFGKGWSSRLAQVQKTGQAMASGSVGPEPIHVPGMNRKAVVEDAKKPVGKSIADAAAGGGLSGVGTITAAKEALEPASGLSETIAMVVTVLTVVVGLIGVAGLAWRFYANRQQRALDEALDVVRPEPVAPLEAEPANENEPAVEEMAA